RGGSAERRRFDLADPRAVHVRDRSARRQGVARHRPHRTRIARSGRPPTPAAGSHSIDLLMQALVTGVAGFIGSTLAERLLAGGADAARALRLLLELVGVRRQCVDPDERRRVAAARLAVRRLEARRRTALLLVLCELRRPCRLAALLHGLWSAPEARHGLSSIPARDD